MSKEAFIYDVGTHPQVARWLKQLAERQPQSFIRLVEENRIRIRKMLGKPDKINKASDNKEWIWKVERDNVVAWIISGELGTVMNMYYPGVHSVFQQDKEIGAQAVALLGELLESLTRSRVPFVVGKKV